MDSASNRALHDVFFVFVCLCAKNVVDGSGWKVKTLWTENATARYLKKWGCRFGQNLVDTLGVWPRWIDSILKIRIQIWIRELFNFLSDSSPFRDRAQNTIERWHDMSKIYGQIMTNLGGQVGEVTRTSSLDFSSGPNPDLAYQWDTKCKLFRLEVVMRSTESPSGFSSYSSPLIDLAKTIYF